MGLCIHLRASMTRTHDTGPTFIDVCCGCGGFTRGLTDVGLRHVAGYDIDPKAVESYNLNFPGTGHEIDVRHLQLPVGAADVLVSGLPCQGHSTLGERRKWDPRNALWKPFLRLVHEVRPLAGA